MKILVANVHFSPDSFGGATVVAEETARRLHERGHEVVIFTSTSDSDLLDFQLFRYEWSGIPVIAVKIPTARTLQQDYFSAEVSRQFGHVLDVVRPDAVHVHALQSLGVGVLERAQEVGIPTVATLHDAWWLCERQFMVRGTGEYCGQAGIDPLVCSTCVPDPIEHELRQQESLSLLNACSLVLTPSAFWRDVMVASGVRADIVRVNGNGVARPDPGWRRSPRRGPARLGYVGGLSPAKGYPQLVEALKQLTRSDYELNVVDSFSNLGIVTMTHEDWPVPGLVRIHSAYTSDTVDRFFDSLDALVFPSQWKESYGLTVREAALRGVWPILGDGGGTADHIVDGVNGTVYERKGGVASMVAALDDYLDRFQDLSPDPVLSALIPTLDEQTDELERYLLDVVSGADRPGDSDGSPASQPPESPAQPGST